MIAVGGREDLPGWRLARRSGPGRPWLLLAAMCLGPVPGACTDAPPTQRWASDGAGIGDDGDPARADGTAAEDLPPPGTCTLDKHCTAPAKPMCEQGTCVACPQAQGDGATFVDEDIPDGTELKPGAAFAKRWRMNNSGASTWSRPCGVSFGHVDGPTLDGTSPVHLADLERVSPGADRDWTVQMTAPSTPGTYRGYWQMARSGVGFGTKVWVDIEVTQCVTDADCLDFQKTQCQTDGSCAAPLCVVDADCTDASQPYCTTAGCVQCKTASHCPASAPQCQQGTCIAPGACGNGPKPVLGQTAWPTPTKKTLCQSFGNAISYQTCGFHTGIDICASDGDPLLAIAAGKVVHVGPMWYDTTTTGRGPYAVIIQHSTNFYATYSHNSAALVKVGDCVTTGQQIAQMGNLGYSYGPHLHFEIVDGTPFTGDWAVPFANACSYYTDPMKLIAP